jgi:hypothetical protein
MGVLVVTCQATQKKFSTGIQIERDDLNDAAWDTALSAFCPYCRKTHQYRYRDAQYVETLLPKDWIENM